MFLRWLHIVLLVGLGISKVTVKGAILFAVQAEKEISYNCEGVKIVTRKEWKARNAVREREMILPVNHVIILHTVTMFCKKELQCTRDVQFIQELHLDERGWWDIAYNFLIGGDGRVYEARGWNLTGAHAVNYNTNSLGVAFIGNFNKDKPTKQMLDAALKLIDCGVKRGYLTPTREIHGHRDVACTESPGDNLYKEIRQWWNYKGGRLPMYYCRPLNKPVINQDMINDN